MKNLHAPSGVARLCSRKDFASVACKITVAKIKNESTDFHDFAISFIVIDF